MPRIARKNISTSFFHVLVQGINKSYIFDKREDIMSYLEIINKYKERKQIRIKAYCIMNNHAHLLINTENIDELSAFMHDVNTTYAVYYNKKYKRVGYVFRDRYKAEGIYTDRQLYYCIEYIHNNPVKAGICKTKEEYEFSSAREIKSNKGKEEEINMNFLEIDEDKEQMIEEIIKVFLKEENLREEDLIKNKDKLSKLLKILKTNNKISFRKIEKRLDISRETLRKLLK